MSSSSLITKVLALLSPDAVRTAADSTGESRDTMRKLLEGAIPAVLAGLSSQPTHATAASLLDVLRGGAAGVDLLALVFGPRAAGVAEALAHWAGVKPAVATQGLRTGSELVLKALADENSKRGFTADTLHGFLHAQQPTLRTFLPAPLVELFGLAPTLPPASTAGQSVSLLVRAAQALAVAAVFASVMTCYRAAPPPAPVVEVAKPVEAPKPAEPRQVEIRLPSGKMLNLLEGSFNYRLVRFLEDKSDRNLPRTFVFDHLNFFTAKTEITPESQPTVADLVAILQAYPETGVRLEGHTDSQGNAEANQKLSENRAVAIRGLLLQQGIAAARMETAGYGQTKPIADNGTEEGRAQNRRLELVVVKK